MNKKIKILFTIIGFLSFVKIINSYGLSVLKEEVSRSGIVLLLIVFTFVPTLVCYSISWLLVTDHKLMKDEISFIKKIFIFTKFTTISIAWNNLTPFLKVGGEPLKYLMLKEHLTKKEAITSTVNYNIIHLLATLLSFLLGALFLMIFYPVTSKIFNFSLGLVFLFLSVFALSVWMLNHKVQLRPTMIGYKQLRVIYINLFLMKKRLELFYKKYPRSFVFSLFFDTFARFIEGLTFYYGFQFIKKPIGLFSAAFLDVGRTLADTIFFFIPYQVGTREEGVRFFMEKVLLINGSGFLTVVLYYRFVEIAWILIGYAIWATSNKEERVLSV